MPPVAIAAAAGAASAFAAGITVTAAGTIAFTATTAAIVASAALSAGTALIAQEMAGGSAAAAAPVPSTVLRQPVPIGQIVYGRARVGGSLAMFHAGEAVGDEKSLHLVQVLACHEIDGVIALYDGDALIWSEAEGLSEDYADKIERIEIRPGTDDQLAIDALRVDLPETLAGDTGLNFRLQGWAYVYLKLPDARKNWPGGLPALWAEIRGAKVHDPRSGATAWSANWALCVADYLTRARGGGGLAWSDLDETSVIAAANISDETVATSAAVGIRRYELHGALKSDVAPRENLNAMMLHGAGQVLDLGGVLAIQAGASGAVAETIGPDDMVGALRIRRATDVEKMPDGVSGTFTRADAAFQPDGFGQVLFADYDPADGAAKMLDLNLERDTEEERVQRCAVLSARRARRRVAISVEVAPSYARLESGDEVLISLPQAGLDEARCEVQSAAWVYGDGAARVALELVETSPDVWAWDGSEVEGIAPAVWNAAPSSRVVLPPTNVQVAQEVRILQDGTSRPVLVVTWDASADFWLARYLVRWRPAGGHWRELTVPAEATAAEIWDAPEGLAVEVLVEAVNLFGRSSGGRAPGVALPPPVDTTPPSAPGSFSAVGGVDRVILQWTLPPEPDFAAVILRESESDDFASAVEVWRGSVRSCERSGIGYVDPRHWWAAAVDRSGNVSEWVGPVSAAALQVAAEHIAQGAVGTVALADGAAVDYGAGTPGGRVAGGDYEWANIHQVNVARDMPGALLVMVRWSAGGLFPPTENEAGSITNSYPFAVRVLLDGVVLPYFSVTASRSVTGGTHFDSWAVIESEQPHGLSSILLQMDRGGNYNGHLYNVSMAGLMFKRGSLPNNPPDYGGADPVAFDVFSDGATLQLGAEDALEIGEGLGLYLGEE